MQQNGNSVSCGHGFAEDFVARGKGTAFRVQGRGVGRPIRVVAVAGDVPSRVSHTGVCITALTARHGVTVSSTITACWGPYFNRGRRGGSPQGRVAWPAVVPARIVVQVVLCD